jgi:hypothetical protein
MHVTRPIRGLATAVAIIAYGLPAFAEPVSKASNMGSIVNTRHNLTQDFLGTSKSWMDGSRNDYGEVCVYCHTPHGANATVAAPLWNRTIRTTTYTTYNQLGTSTANQTYTQPGAGSLTCLSCHDGQTAVDSIINMPGSGNYSAAQISSQNNEFLDSWANGPGQNAWAGWGGHGTLSNTPATLSNYGECQSCHSISGDQHDPATIPKFDVFFIGTDLRNDHPVGVLFPASNPDFRSGTVDRGYLRFYDSDGNGHADKNEIRLYNTGDGFEVECATCHDPHGVPTNGAGSQFTKTFLRVENTASAVCLTCHVK